MKPLAFISYRRHDAFMLPADDGTLRDFIGTIRDGLGKAGFDVFLDKDDVTQGHYEYQLREGIAKADLFVAVIGKDWMTLLDQRLVERKANAEVEEDMVLREVRAALRKEKEILPLLVDDAKMPSLTELPPEIRPLHYANAVNLQSTDTAEAIAAKLRPVFGRMERMRKLEARWDIAYVCFSVLAWLICAVLTHLVGWREYGTDAWLGMAKAWGGFFIWPVVCLPFALLALYRPLTLVFKEVGRRFEGGNRIESLKASSTYLMPLVFALILTLLAMVAEVFGEYETPWTVHPRLAAQCTGARGDLPNRDAGLRAALFQYDADGTLATDYETRNVEVPFWLADKCWPGVFYYLIEPAFRQIKVPSYFKDRPAIQGRFAAVLERKTTRAPYSWTFWAYVASFFVQIWLAATGVVLSMFYAKVPTRGPDNRVLKLPSEDAYLCLTYAFVTLMVWIPFRLNTVYIKNLYFCTAVENGCPLSVNHYQNDILLLLVLAIGYGYLTVQLLQQFGRKVVVSFGAAAIALIFTCAALIIAYSDSAVRLTDDWQFYFRCCIFVFVVLIALWFQFDPKHIRDREFERDIRLNENSGRE